MKCPRCGGSTDEIVCDECYIDLRHYQQPLKREESMVATPVPDGPDVLKKLVHWMIGTDRAESAADIWTVAKYRNETTIAIAATTLFFILSDVASAEGVAIGEWIRKSDADKADDLRKLEFDTGSPDDPNSSFNVLLRDWAIRALVEWSNSQWARTVYPPPKEA